METFIENGSITSPLGFEAAAATCGLKQGGSPDCALIYSDLPVTVAGAFTANAFCAAPVELGKRTVQNGNAVHAVFINSGNANACTGEQGLSDATKTAEFAAQTLGCESSQVMVSSTGRIGVVLPMKKILHGIELCVTAKHAEGGLAAAEAIMTTDTRPKSHAVRFTAADGRQIVVGGMAKGAGMIAPKLKPAVPHATMLAYITTDAVVDKSYLQSCLASALSESFNRITVDGDTSTNDTVLLLANGAAENEIIRADSPDAPAFANAVTTIMALLARDIVLDGEGATKFVRIVVSGAKTDADAQSCARAIAESPLCKTAWFGGDPNWGRILAAAGYAGVEIATDQVSLDYDDIPIVRNGMDAGVPESEQEAVLKKDEFTVRLNLGVGTAETEFWTCDMSYEYVKINADYHT
jgi:glutamate N-acetyltransferase/amino-acid N-acetyltransferase